MEHFESLYPSGTRSQEVEKIIELIKSGRSIQLIGLPGVGRSNLLELLSYNRNVRIKHLGENQKWFHFVYMDFSEVKKRSLFDVVKFMLISTAYSLSERNLKKEYEVVNGYIKEAVGFSDELILFQALKKAIDFLAIEKQLTIVFLFDRFEEYLQDVSQQFFLNLKVLRNRAKYRFSAVFSLSRPLEDVLDQFVLSEFYDFVAGNQVFVSLFDPVGIDFRLSYLLKATGKKLVEKSKKEIIELCGGHGKLTKLCFEAILSESSQQKNLAQFLLEKKTVRAALFEIWNHLTPVEQAVLIEKNQGKTLVGEEDSYLNKIGLLKNNKLTIVLLEQFVEDLPRQARAEEIRFDEQTNEIVKGNIEITDRLSALEFRLLRFLIQNKNRVCEKDEIILAVWKDTKTQEGVTDQALDQIVYRLRKKIEENPNLPAHILTVKGRGFRLAQ